MIYTARLADAVYVLHAFHKKTQITAIIRANDWKQVDAATHCGVTQPRVNDLLRGRVSRFSLDALVNIATALGRRVHVELQAT